MPKLKTKSGAKKRFKVTATGKVKYQQSGKRHGMIKRTTKQIREHRGTNVLFKTDGDNIKKYFLILSPSVLNGTEVPRNCLICLLVRLIMPWRLPDCW